jgi:hypothetical protein
MWAAVGRSVPIPPGAPHNDDLPLPGMHQSSNNSASLELVPTGAGAREPDLDGHKSCVLIPGQFTCYSRG